MSYLVILGGFHQQSTRYFKVGDSTSSLVCLCQNQMRWNWQSCCGALNVSKSCFITTPPAHHLSFIITTLSPSPSPAAVASSTNTTSASSQPSQQSRPSSPSIPWSIPHIGRFGGMEQSIFHIYAGVPYDVLPRKKHRFRNPSILRRLKRDKIIVIACKFKSPNLHHQVLPRERLPWL